MPVMILFPAADHAAQPSHCEVYKWCSHQHNRRAGARYNIVPRG